MLAMDNKIGDKQALREQLKSKRQKLAREEVDKCSSKIVEHLLEMLDLSSIQSLHTYLPVPGLNEIDTWPLLHFIWQNYKHIKTASWEGHGRNSKAVWINQQGQKSPFPESFQFDVVVVPLLGFDANNHRLGFGGGFYDQFLASQIKARKIGLAYQQGFIPGDLPAEIHDVKLDAIVTEEKVYKA
jgi:5-formyltetrahydrofolate cyclo-ligase